MGRCINDVPMYDGTGPKQHLLVAQHSKTVFIRAKFARLDILTHRVSHSRVSEWIAQYNLLHMSLNLPLVELRLLLFPVCGSPLLLLPVWRLAHLLPHKKDQNGSSVVGDVLTSTYCFPVCVPCDCLEDSDKSTWAMEQRIERNHGGSVAASPGLRAPWP